LPVMPATPTNAIEHLILDEKYWLNPA